MANSSLEIWPSGIDGAKQGVTVCSCSAVLFWIISLICERCTPKIADKQKWRFKNISVSMIHAIVSGLWSVICFIEEPQMAEDLIKTHTTMGHTLIAVSVDFIIVLIVVCNFFQIGKVQNVLFGKGLSRPLLIVQGYFLYDTIDMLIYQRNRQTFELLLHHVVIIACFGLAVFTKLYVGYAVLALIVELNSVFLHFRQLLQCCGYKRTNNFYRLNSLINLGTFLVFRILTLAWMTRWIVINKDLVPLVFFSIGSIGLAIMTVMNIILFYRLLHSDFLRKKECIKKEE